MPHSEGVEALRRAVGDDPAFQRRVWRVQRWGWGVMALIVVLAALGAFGGGPLSRREARSGDGALRISHEAVARQDFGTIWRVSLPPGADSLTISSPSLAGLPIASIQPAPLRAARSEGVLRLDFAPPPAAATEVMLVVEPDGPGVYQVSIAAGGAAAGFSLLVLP